MTDNSMYELMERIKKARRDIVKAKPLIHCITNPISINDCANIVLAVGGRPMMAEHPGEVAEITAVAGALALNLGNITDARLKSMAIAAKTAKEREIPVILDLVGTACSSMRKEYAAQLIDESCPAVIKGNISEVLATCGMDIVSSGIDANEGDLLNSGNLASYRQVLRPWAAKHNTVLLVSGPTDYVTDGKTDYLCNNGNEMLSSITGTGCMLNALTAVFLTALAPVEAAAFAASLMGMAAEKASIAAGGPGSFHMMFFDELYRLSDDDIVEMAKVKYYK